MSLTITITGGTVQLTGNSIWVKLSGAVPPANSFHFKCLLKVISTDGKLFGSPFIDAIAPDSHGESLFDVSGYIDQPVTSEFQYPASTKFVKYPSQIFNVEFQSGISYFDDKGDFHETWDAGKIACKFLKGGASYRQIALWNSADTNFEIVYLLTGRFLTHRPQGDFVHPNQPVKLWFIPVEAVSAQIEITCFYDDGSNVSSSYPVALTTDSLFEFNCNPAVFSIPMDTGLKKISFFEYKLTDGTNITDTRRFTVDWRYCKRPFYLLFANSIGGIDDVYLSGYAKDRFVTTGEILQITPEANAKVTDPSLIIPSKTGQNKWLINTGFKTETQMLHLRDLFVSRQAWLLYPNLNVSNYTIIPVIITPTDADLLDKQETIHSYDIEIEEAHMSSFSFDNRLF